MNADKKTFNLLWLTIAVAGFICLITVGVTWHRKAKLVSGWSSIFIKLEEDFDGSVVPPTPKNIFTIQKEYKWLLSKQKEVRGLLKSKSLPVEKLTPLEFKEKLLNYDTKLKQLASIQSSQIPSDLGFPEYVGGEIPQVNEVELLDKQLIVINEIVDLMLKHRIEQIGSIERLPYIYYSEDSLYKEIVFRFKIKCVFENFLQVLIDLPKTSFFSVVRNVQLDKLDENTVEAELIIGIVEFNK